MLYNRTNLYTCKEVYAVTPRNYSAGHLPFGTMRNAENPEALSWYIPREVWADDPELSFGIPADCPF